MKKIFLSAAFILLTGIVLGQTFQKGNIVGFHVGTINLEPDVTFDQYKNFMINKYIPEFDKVFQGDIKLYIAEGERGSDVNCIGILWVFKSIDMRDKYFVKDGQSTELADSKFEQLRAKLSANYEEYGELGTYTEKYYTDWVMQ